MSLNPRLRHKRNPRRPVKMRVAGQQLGAVFQGRGVDNRIGSGEFMQAAEFRRRQRDFGV